MNLNEVIDEVNEKNEENNLRNFKEIVEQKIDYILETERQIEIAKQNADKVRKELKEMEYKANKPFEL